jgi:hypothetical protein
VPLPPRRRAGPLAMSMAVSAAAPSAAAAPVPSERSSMRRSAGRKSGVRLAALAPCTPRTRTSPKLFRYRCPLWQRAAGFGGAVYNYLLLLRRGVGVQSNPPRTGARL